MATAPRYGAVMPVVLMVSMLAHVAAYIVLAFVPPPAVIHPEPSSMELAFETIEPEPIVEVEPEPPPEPEPEPEPEPAAILEPERRRPEPPPEAAPPPPAPVMTADADDAQDRDFAMNPGEEGGSLDGVPGGTGTDDGLAEAPPAPAPEPAPRGLSRRELRARLLAYVRNTLSGYVGDHLDYPLAARRAQNEGVVMLRLRLASDGRILSVRLASTSGHDILDRAALARVNGLGSMPAPPGDIPWDEELELPLPVTYRLQ